ncbi:hypothetical protein [Methylobacterium sp. 391_Methyba4]|uniref:hypothetical protein n=1 Tax=Methylobacterium sp. 391_Methyba4 TaxID=3038924 RepID=UPI00241F0988|nr:hypothetical protein [Methylobacterium sp. 391_Methyba4]WFS06210.1 hypothetical protein P9K36_22830 [Methylobacterium sp. 391_Methyba4]
MATGHRRSRGLSRRSINVLLTLRYSIFSCTLTGLAMSSDHAAKLAATLEVLRGAVGFLIAERVAAQPVAIQDDLISALQDALSQTPGMGRDPVSPWIPVVAADMIDEVRRQIGHPAGAAASRGAARSGPAQISEVAEGPSREYALGAIAHFEARRAVA